MDDPAAPGVTTDASSALTRSVLAPNPGVMTLEGTNTYAVAAPGSPTVVIVDPGPLEEDHVARLLALGTIELVLVTHHHVDHSGAAPYLHEVTGAPVRAASIASCIGGAQLVDGEEFTAAGVRFRVVTTPGHTSDSLCLHLPDDGPEGSVITGDTLLGSGSTVLMHPDGDLGDYFASLDRLQSLGSATVLPGHGPVLPDIAAACELARNHRLGRLAEVRDSLGRLGAEASAAAVTDDVYHDTDAVLRPAAEASVRAQLQFLRSQQA